MNTQVGETGAGMGLSINVPSEFRICPSGQDMRGFCGALADSREFRSLMASSLPQRSHLAQIAGMAKRKDLLQFAALPWRLDDKGMRQVMLLTSRETQRWVVPKGWPMKGKKPTAVIAQEAFEEAGILGKAIGKKPLGNFHYPKRLRHRTVLCEVWVYLFRVEQQLATWPEMQQRQTQWFDANEAAELVDESGLAAIIERFAGSQVRFFAYRRGKRKAYLTGQLLARRMAEQED